jgi:hypothetical protein
LGKMSGGRSVASARFSRRVLPPHSHACLALFTLFALFHGQPLVTYLWSDFCFEGVVFASLISPMPRASL